MQAVHSTLVSRDKVNILLVEDNLDHAELIINCLESNGLTRGIHHVIDGRIALDYLFKCVDLPDLVLLDLRLPKVDGLEVLKCIKSDNRLKRLPVVILTTSESEVDIIRAYDEFANSYLVKPIDYDKLEKLMGDLGVYWLRHNVSPG
jgi:CheY-like chemotaxis protein